MSYCWWGKQRTGLLGFSSSFQIFLELKYFKIWMGFPGGSVIKNLAANTGATGSTPGPGRSHMSRSNRACEPQLLSLCSRAGEPLLLSHVPQLLKPECPRACALKQEKPPQRETHTPQPESSPCGPQLEKSSHSNKDPAQPKVN